MRLLPAIVAALAWLAAGAVAKAQPAHPLAGKIVDTRSGAVAAFSDPALIPKLFPCGAITLLGEVHDNAEHHRMRGELIRSATGAVRGMPASCGRGGLVFEHITADQSEALKRFYEFDRRARRPANTGDFFRLLSWSKSGWPDSELFRPLFREALRGKQQIYVGGPSQAWVKQIYKEGIGAIPPERISQLKLETPLPEALLSDLSKELQESHCGFPTRPQMAEAQQYKDSYMAEQLLKAANAQGNSILFAGNGHVRADRGVPYMLRLLAPERTVVTVAFVETEDGKTDPLAYGPKDPAGKPATDYVAFALPAEREDPCEQMRKHMKKQ